MAKCADCAWFPWKPGADVSILPAMRCSPKLTARRWTPAGMTMEHECPEFKPADGEAELSVEPLLVKEEQVEPVEIVEQAFQGTAPEQEQVAPEQEVQVTPETQEQEPEEEEYGEVKVDDANTGVEDAAQETAKRANTGRRKR